MTLARKLVLRNAALLAGLLLLGMASLAGLLRLHSAVRITIKEYDELRMVERMVLHASTARALLLSPDSTPDEISTALDKAADSLRLFETQHRAEWLDNPHDQSEQRRVAIALQMLERVQQEIAAEGLPAPPEASVAWSRDLAEVLAQMNVLAREADDLVSQTRHEAQRSAIVTLIAVATLFAVIAVGSVLIGIGQYRGVMRPLQRLRDGVRRVASGQFSQRLGPLGDREFNDLAAEFNRMSEELDDLYRTLEEKVAQKSRELVASERLASVGFLAAGVAHEINNPLNIMSGFAELTLKRLHADGDGDADTLRSLQIIRDEAFRCKRITQQLLSLSRPGGGRREPVALTDLIHSVAEMISAHQAYEDRALILETPDEPLTVSGDETELRQVLINLVVNALEATDPGVGRVRIAAVRDGDEIVIVVEDNGVGIAPDALTNVFEPFYSARITDPLNRSRRGLGLGLSISRAIVDAHGGRIRAESEGPGRGSRFSVTFPAPTPLRPAAGSLTGAEG